MKLTSLTLPPAIPPTIITAEDHEDGGVLVRANQIPVLYFSTNGAIYMQELTNNEQTLLKKVGFEISLFDRVRVHS